MKKIILIFLGIFFLSSQVNAETFSSALSKAYKNNSQLNAERENINVSEQDLNIARGSYLPTITLEGTESQEDTTKLTNQSGGDASISDVDPSTRSVSITQTLIDFGRGADLAKNKIGIDLAKAKLLKKEQDILYKTTEAYTGLISANEKLEINRANVELLSRQVETDRIRLSRGQISLSDVSQSESHFPDAELHAQTYAGSQVALVTERDSPHNDMIMQYLSERTGFKMSLMEKQGNLWPMLRENALDLVLLNQSTSNEDEILGVIQKMLMSSYYRSLCFLSHPWKLAARHGRIFSVQGSIQRGFQSIILGISARK